MATATATMEVSSSLIQSESHYTESVKQVKKKKSTRRHNEEGTVSVSKSSEKLHKKMKSAEVDNPQCAKCGRPVYAMERVKAEKRTWHKECFRCAQCNKQLTVETYESDHTTLYCKPHFKQLFGPKPVEGNDEPDTTPKKHQLIICESNPVELPPDVVRASDKPDLGLEELSQLDVKSRFEMFENRPSDEPKTLDGAQPREKSTALLSKLAKFKAKGMDIGVSDEYLNGVPVEDSSDEQEDDEDDEDALLKKSYKQCAAKELPVPLCNMNEIKNKWETGHDDTAERHRSRKQEIQNIRSRLFMGKQAKIKEMYEESVKQSEQSITSADKISRELDLDVDKARSIKQKFETGEVFNDENQPPRNREYEDTTLFNDGIGKKSRSIFLELDANAKTTPISPPPQEAPKRKELPFVPKDVVRSDDKVEEVKIETADISDRFKFFETYKPTVNKKEFRITPPRQQRPKSPSPPVYRDPGVVRATSPSPAEIHLATERHTASKMIHVFKQMEDQHQHDTQQQGPKPLKRFTPPPPGAYTRDSESESDSEEEERRAYLQRQEDEALQQAQQLARTKSFRSKFENWSENEPQRSPSQVVIERTPSEEDGESQLDTAKSLRAKFENMQMQQSNVTRTVSTKVNRFV